MSRRRNITYGVLCFLVVVLVSVYLVLQSEWLVNRIISAAVARLEALGARVMIGEVSGNVLTGIALSKIDVTLSGDEEPILSADALSIRYSPIALLTKREMGTLSLYGPRLILEKKNGKWNYSQLLKPKDSTEMEEAGAKPSQPGGALPFSLKHMSIQNGLVEIRAERKIEVSKINLFSSVTRDSTKSVVTLHSGRFLLNKKLAVTRLSGRVKLDPSGLSLEDFEFRTPKSRIALSAEMDSLSRHISLGDSRIHISEFSDALLPDLALKGTIELSGTYVETKEKRSAAARMVLSGGEFKGKSLGSLDLLLKVDDSEYDVSLSRWQLAEGSARGSVHLDLSGKVPSFRVDCNMEALDLGRFIDRQAVLSGDIRLNGMGKSVETARAKGQVNLKHGLIEGVDLEELSTSFSYSSGVVDLEILEAKTCGGWLRTQGTVSKRQLELDTEIRGIDLSYLSKLVGTSEIKGIFSSYMWVSGPLDNPSLSGTAWISNAEYKGRSFGHLGVNVNIQDAVREPKGSATIDFAAVDAGGPVVKRGSIEIIAQNKELEYEVRATADEGSLDVRGKALIKNGGFEGQLDKLHILYRGQVMENLSPIAASYSQSGVVLAPARVRVLGSEMRLTGLTLTQEEARIGLAADSLKLKNLATAFGSKLDIDGSLGFSLDVSGTPQDPRISFHFDLRDIVAGQASIDSARASLSYAQGSLSADEFLIYRNGHTSSLSGRFPINLAMDAEGGRIPEAPITLDADFNDLGAWIFLPLKNMVDVAEGRIDADLSLRGTPRSPRMTGTMSIASPKVIFRPTLTTVADVAAKLRLEGERLEIISVSGRAGEGDVDVNGFVTFKGLSPEDYVVRVKARNAGMEGFYRDIHNAVVNADMVVKRGNGMLNVEGDVEVLRCLLTTEFRTRATPMAASKHEVSYDIRVHGDRNIKLENRDAALEMATDVRVRWQPGTMVLSGNMEILSGTFVYSGVTQPFYVRKGEFIFSNAPELNPSLDVLAEAMVRVKVEAKQGEAAKDSSATILLTVSGTMLEPEFRLSSTDPNLTDTQILALLGFGMDPTQMGVTQFNPLTQAGDVSFGILRDRIVRQLERSLGVDDIEVQTELFGSEKSAELKVGKYVRPDLYVSYSHNLFARVKDEYKVEYYLWKGSSIVGSRDDMGNYNMGVGFKLRY